MNALDGEWLKIQRENHEEADKARKEAEARR